MSEKPSITLVETTEQQALGDLAAGASQRLSRAAWDARQACEHITYAGYSALEEITRAEHALAEARRHATALLVYRGSNGK